MDPDDPRQRFAGQASGYARHRPGYPDGLVDEVLAHCGAGPGAPVADVGCGTGLLTRMLVARGLDVVGIDPNEDMLAEARAVGGARYLRGEAAATGLAPRSVAVVTVAQAFHWFPVDPALAEFARILRRGGWVAAIYNLRAEGELMADYEALLRRFSTRYATVESWQATLDMLQTRPDTRDHASFEAGQAQELDWDGLRGRAWSSSYVFRGVADGDGFDSALRRLFLDHARDGTVLFPYHSRALVFRLAGRP